VQKTLRRSLPLLFATLMFGCASNSSAPPNTDPQPQEPDPISAPAQAPTVDTPPHAGAPPELGTARQPMDCSHQSLESQSKAQLRVTRNTVFAQHGRIFSSEDLNAHFEAQPWYTPNPDYQDSLLSKEDYACVKRVGVWENSAGRMWQAKEDLDGDGTPETITLLASTPLLMNGPDSDSDNPCDGECPATLTIGLVDAPILFHWPEGAYFGDKTYSIIDIDPTDGHKEVLISQRRMDWEDPPYLNRIFIYKNGTLTPTDLNGEGYDAGTIEVPGDGRIALVDWDCATKTWNWYAIDDYWLTQVDTKTEEAPGAEDFKMDDGSYACPACPVVYAAGSSTPAGEILRNLATPKRKGWQRLHLPLSAASLNDTTAQITLRLAEEKLEVTYVDAVRLVIGETHFEPNSCAKHNAAWCDADGEVLRLAQGQDHTFVFDVPVELVARGVWLEALGHYEPVLRSSSVR